MRSAGGGACPDDAGYRQERTGRIVTRSSRPGKCAASQAASGVTGSRRAAPRRGGRGRGSSRLVPGGQVAKRLAGHDEHEVRLVAPRRARPLQRREVSTVYDGPYAVELDPARRRTRVAGDGSSTIASRSSAGLIGRSGLWGGSRPGRTGRGRARAPPAPPPRSARCPCGWGRTCPRGSRGGRGRRAAGGVTSSLNDPTGVLPLELRARRSGPCRPAGSPPCAVRRRCRAGRGPAGTAPPTPRCRSSSGTRSARSACRGRGTPRPRGRAMNRRRRLDPVDDDAGRLRRLGQLSPSGSSAATAERRGVESLAAVRGERDTGIPSARSCRLERRPGLARLRAGRSC
jgi:hypothetical protein